MSQRQGTRSAWGWYAVKTAYRTLGRWKAPPGKRAFPGRVSDVEERVVVVRARSCGEAADRGLAEARRYASKSEVSKGGPQWGKTRVVDGCATYALGKAPRVEGLLFSLSDYHKREVPLREILQNKFNGRRIQHAIPVIVLRES